MNDKEKVIINSAIKLFAQKGFTSTSVQEIVSESGISKGAFYLSFKSKDALLVAILNYYSETLENRITELDDQTIPPKEKFISQLAVLMKTLIENKEFIIMQTREQAIPVNEEVKKIIYKMHMKMHYFYHRNLLDIYGSKINPYLWDASFILEGIFQSYLKMLFFDKDSFNIDTIASFIFNRINTIVNDLLESSETPLLSNKKIKQILLNAQGFFENENRSITSIIANMKREINELDNKDDLEVSMEVLEHEISRDNPRTAVIQGMLFNFTPFQQFNDDINHIKKIYQIK